MIYKYLRIASDLHLEAFYGKSAEELVHLFLQPDKRDGESILMLAGDISSSKDQLCLFLEACGERFSKIYYIPGNHEYYKHDLLEYPKELHARLCDELKYGGLEFSFHDVGYEELENVGGQSVRFIFNTLWADGGPSLADRGTVGFYLNDFRLVKIGQTFFNVPKMVELHDKAKAEIERLLRIPFEGKTVVMSHHLPSRRLVSPRFWPKDGSDGANGGFASNCDNMLAQDWGPDFWIHGHTHDTIDTVMWNTRVLCNPCGYRGEWDTCWNTFVMGPVFVELEAPTLRHKLVQA